VPWLHYILACAGLPQSLNDYLITWAHKSKLRSPNCCLPQGSFRRHVLASTMVVKIRLSRFGNKRQPFYNIVVSQAR
jgi:hypothetical protein